MTYAMADVSWGKDSTAMLHVLLDGAEPLDEVVFYDTGMEFMALYAERDRMLPTLAEAGVRYTELRPRRPMLYDMLCKPIRHRDGTEGRGYGWCGGPCRWGTSAKTAVLDAHARRAGAGIVYVGIAADETARIVRPRDASKRLPLVERGVSEADCLALCYERGHEWSERGVRLYDVLDRVSCWCCRNKNLRELSAMREALPEYYGMLRALEQSIGEPMKKRAGFLE